ncbi:MAG: hypothetical protein V7636_315 [Actinomycetota bacterium]|jgi:hypothetical protein
MVNRCTRVVGAIALVATFAGCGHGNSASKVSSGASYHPEINPAKFSAVVDNPWFPLKPGSTYVYEGTKDAKLARDVYAVTRNVTVIDGVRCVEVDDRLYLDGTLEEKTTDFYTQDADGNVWYFGEATAELDEQGRVTTTEGSWRAGEHGAQPGLFMEASPVVGHAHRQEYDPGNAEDQFEILDLDTSVAVPLATYQHALLTKETTALEPDVVDHKYYVKGIGEVAEITVKGPTETSKLVSWTKG